MKRDEGEGRRRPVAGGEGHVRRRIVGRIGVEEGPELPLHLQEESHEGLQSNWRRAPGYEVGDDDRASKVSSNCQIGF